ncbi:hypothetical protein [Streptomyces sp. NPDC048295]|uniref:hypothetical protein n=1 Tax=Streptomyces sp. NPDC048295 TaxID=3154617 RepID=UPI0034493C14
MSADPGTTGPGPDDEAPESGPGPGNSYRDNQQRVDQGLAVMGGIAGDANVFIGVQPDEDISERIPKPRLREGPYPAEDVRARLYGFVEPPTHTRCRKVLDSHLLLLRAGSGTGAGTAAFALLAERYGADGVTGLDSPDGLSRWRPKERRGYLLQGLSPEAAGALGEVGLTALAGQLRSTGAHLVVTVRMETALPGDTVPWQVTHRPPPAGEVAVKRLRAMAEAGELTAGQEADALRHLASPDFTGQLDAHPLPGDGVAVAEGLRGLVVAGKSAASVLDDLRTGSPEAARKALAEARDRADLISLMAAISLLPDQDRTVVERFGAVLRRRIDGRAGPVPAAAGGPGPAEGSSARHGVLGPAFEDRLAAVGARLLPTRYGAAQRYPVQPVDFSGRHRSEALLRSLWLEYEGMAELLWKSLDEAPHHPGVELAAGEAIGKVLAHATGPDTLRQLYPFASSDKRWRRRLVANALGEMVQHPALSAAVREQLRQWSGAAPVALRCTVAETCGGSYGLARPAVALRLLDTALGRADEKLGVPLRTAVSFALSVLLSEDANHPLVLDLLRKWQDAGPGSPRHGLAVHAVESMSRDSFPLPGAPGVRRVRLADLLAVHPERARGLVVAGLDDPATHATVAAGLFLIEGDPELRRRTAFPRLLADLAAVARNHRGVLRFVLRHHRARTASTERLAS